FVEHRLNSRERFADGDGGIQSHNNKSLPVVRDKKRGFTRIIRRLREHILCHADYCVLLSLELGNLSQGIFEPHDFGSALIYYHRRRIARQAGRKITAPFHGPTDSLSEIRCHTYITEENHQPGVLSSPVDSVVIVEIRRRL